ncbi:hypothetical protein QO034_08345 [Sedimentitalea sp. JM2-8]|uniref:Iron-containing redox enzyme n=1 Tax=Sedimentitalea xiamensis TaxID=3050037 RepID=A0ABT7FDC1_9RHOB|nr:hypothetical protein [Sedimentitalea xiamensis]MDK3073114.1 hypothetical protein [Sedimentitalea xiamensis]
MSNVIKLTVPFRRQGAAARRAALIASFAQHRRLQDDVFWLKENAELLNILECTGASLDDDTLSPLQEFYDRLESRLGFFPQYYRFLLSICLDLEDLGLRGNKSEALVRWVAREGLAEAELSDLQRLEARRLMLRRGIDPLPGDGGLVDRVHRFIERPETFAMPNKKAAYELTHIVFYLSEYGRRDPQLSPAAMISLEYAGILAYLEQNSDLLAEVCIALRHAGAEPPAIWEDWIARQVGLFEISAGVRAVNPDDYHDYFVCNWMLETSGRGGFRKAAVADRMAFSRPAPATGPLRAMSECLFRLNDARSDDWDTMRPLVADMLSETGQDVLEQVERSSDRFAEFFAGFARVGLHGPRP